MSRAFVCGLASTCLAREERSFLREAAPLGIILFKRNVDNPQQLRALTSDIRDALGDNALVLVDQEGGRVQRLGPPNWRRLPAAARFSAIADLDERVSAIRLAAQVIASDLMEVGIDVDCLPVLDLPVEGADGIIGDRAYGYDTTTVARCGQAAAQGLLAGGVLPVMKHIPGHGRAKVDSHLALPTVDAAMATLDETDWEPFRLNNDLPAAMTAHVVFADIDPSAPATTSVKVVRDVIRGAIGFDGLLFSDDLSMKALAGSSSASATQLFEAGVDIALHCCGDLKDAESVAAVAPVVEGKVAARVSAALAAKTAARTEFDPVDAAAQIDCILTAAR